MKLSFKDLIREFKPEEKPEAAIEVAAPEPEAPLMVDGATAAIMVEFMDAVDELTGLLEEETGALAAGSLGGLDGFSQRKQAMAERLEGLIGRLQQEDTRLNEDLRAIVLERIERLDQAVSDNASGLVAMRKAVLTINRSILSALEKSASDGLYAPTGHAVRPVELSASGLNAEL